MSAPVLDQVSVAPQVRTASPRGLMVLVTGERDVVARLAAGAERARAERRPVLVGLVEPPRPLTLEEAKPKIAETLKQQRVQAMAAARGTQATQTLRDALKSGTPLDAALAQTALPTEKIPPFALADSPAMQIGPDGKPQMPTEAPDLQMIKGAVVELNPGEVSDYIPTPTGGVIAVLERRDSPDAASYEQAKATFSARFLRSRREVAFTEWLRERRREAGVPETPQSEQPVIG